MVAILMISSSTSTTSERQHLADHGGATTLSSITAPSNTNDAFVVGESVSVIIPSNNAVEERSSLTGQQERLESSLSATVTATVPTASSVSSSSSSSSLSLSVPGSAAQAGDAAISTKEDNPDQPMLLPGADPDDASIPHIALGESIPVEEKDPIMIDTDGPKRPIEKWDQMTELEQQVTWRRIRQRHKERRKKFLLEQQQLQQQQQQDQLEQQQQQPQQQDQLEQQQQQDQDQDSTSTDL